MTTHILQRTSRKGEPFIGTCCLCGEKNLTPIQANEKCSGPKLSTAARIVLALEEPDENKRRC